MVAPASDIAYRSHPELELGQLVSELKKPLNAFRVRQTLEAAVRVLNDARDPEFDGVRQAVHETASIARQHGTSNSCLDHPVNLPLRVSWLEHELHLNSALKLSGGRKTPEILLLESKCEQYRGILTSDRPAVWDLLQTDDIQSRATENNLRLIKGALHNFTDRVSELARADSTKLHAHFDELRRFAAQFPDGFAPNYIGPVSRIFLQLSSDIIRIADDASSLHPTELSAVAAERADLIKDCFSRFSKKFLPEGTAPGISIEMYKAGCALPSEADLRQLVELSTKLQIHPAVMEPQRGFLSAYTLNELRQCMSDEFARTLLVRRHGEAIGCYVLSTNMFTGPERARKVHAELEKRGIELAGPIGWVDTVGIAENERIASKLLGADLYSMVHSAAISAAEGCGLQTLFLQVRAGAQANLAAESHIRRGWKRTGVEVPNTNRIPYEIMTLDLPATNAAHRLSQIDLSIRRMSEPSRPPHIVMTESEIVLQAERSIAQSNRGADGLRVKTVETPNGLEVAISFGKRNFVVTQQRPMRDEWRMTVDSREITGALREVLQEAMSGMPLERIS